MKRLMIGVAVLVVGVLAYSIQRAGAFGVPSTTPLSYTGTLLTFGQPDNSAHSISAGLWLPGGTSPACASTATNIQVVNGQFTVPLPVQCSTVIHQNPNAQVQVTVDTVAMGFTSLAAVPYALEAGSVTGSQMLANIGLSATVASNALTINLLQDDAVSVPTQTNPGIIGFRSLTAGSGALTPIEVTTALPALVVPSGATLGQVSGTAEHTYVYAQDNAGSVQLCVNTAGDLDEGSLQASLLLNASATSRSTLYCAAAATGPVRLIGRIATTEATAGTWATAPAEVSTPPFMSSRGPAFEAFPSTAVNASGSTFVKIPFDTVEFDTDGAFDTVNHRFKPSTPGYYRISMQVYITMIGGNGFTLLLNLDKNGAELRQQTQLINYGAGFSQTLTLETNVYMNGTTDYLDGWFWTNFGTATYVAGAANTYMSGEFIHS